MAKTENTTVPNEVTTLNDAVENAASENDAGALVDTTPEWAREPAKFFAVIEKLHIAIFGSKPE